METLIKLLEEVNNEVELIENLIKQTLEGDKEATITAARIQAGRDIRFDLKKIEKESR